MKRKLLYTLLVLMILACRAANSISPFKTVKSLTHVTPTSTTGPTLVPTTPTPAPCPTFESIPIPSSGELGEIKLIQVREGVQELPALLASATQVTFYNIYKNAYYVKDHAVREDNGLIVFLSSEPRRASFGDAASWLSGATPVAIGTAAGLIAVEVDGEERVFLVGREIFFSDQFSWLDVALAILNFNKGYPAELIK